MIVALLCLGFQTPALVKIEARGGAEFDHTAAMSIDGTTVVGKSTKGAFRWTPTRGFQLLFPKKSPRWDFSEADHVSRDGSVIVGAYANQWSAFSLYRWTNGRVDTLPTKGLDHAPNRSMLVSSDGKTLLLPQAPNKTEASHHFLRPGGKKVRLQAVGLSKGPFPEDRWFMSGDGRFAFGNLFLRGNFKASIYRWDWTGKPTRINFAGPSRSVLNLLRGVNRDGSVLVGEAQTDAGDYGVLWRNGKTTQIYAPSRDGNDSIFGFSDDGTVVSGHINKKGFLWTEASGSISAAKVLQNAGLRLPVGREIENVPEVQRHGGTVYMVLRMVTPSLDSHHYWARVPFSALRR